ncbi:MAG: hypothetical protein RLZZ365_576, partial [Pseudomonadota bacterium]
LAKQLTALAPITQKASKLIVARVIGNSLPNCDDLINEVYGSLDFKEGVTAFLAGRSPNWQGK